MLEAMPQKNQESSCQDFKLKSDYEPQWVLDTKISGLTDRRLQSGLHLQFGWHAGSRILADYSGSRTTGRRLP
jgi:hypothetical protein